MDAQLQSKFDRLRELLRGYGSVLVAYSGGVDSAFLARVAHDTLGTKALSVIADTPSLPRRELAEALQLGEEFGFSVRVVKTHEFENNDYVANPPNRCYFCKHDLFSELVPVAQAEELAVIAYGENASDIGDFRPGADAAAKFQVRAPLKEAGLTKADIRALSASLGLPTAQKPQMACLSSRVPYGESVTPQALGMIEAAENALWNLGFHDVRVRHHRGGANGAVPFARIEVAPDQIARLTENNVRETIVNRLKEIGYAYVALDLQGYRRGSANEVLPTQTTLAEKAR
ncbi:MAG: ATP-dependent sacrificial sulfur transferase LarE [Verrucomicrobia bacterium]|nr:ATP-dependent sacrificial sulfur transferase LarE [Verrucomicrobiota bacterium]